MANKYNTIRTQILDLHNSATIDKGNRCTVACLTGSEYLCICLQNKYIYIVITFKKNRSIIHDCRHCYYFFIKYIR